MSNNTEPILIDETYHQSQEFKLTKSLGETEMNLYEAQNKLHEAQQLAEIDPLTGLLNRRGLERMLIQNIALARRNNSPLSVAYIDVDGLKRMNETHGHAAGDELLKAIAQILKLRDSDIVARLGEGSDEIAIILPNTDSSSVDEQSISVAETLTQRLRQRAEDSPFSHPSKTDNQIHQSIAGFSIGFATLKPGEDPESLLNRADLAMQQDKTERKRQNPNLPIRD